MRHRSVIVAAIGLFSLFNPTRLRSQIVVGTLGGPDCLPFICNQGLAGYQQIYAASAFPGPMNITGLTFFLVTFPFGPPVLAPGDYSISLAISNKPIGSLSTNPVENISFGEQLFFSSALPTNLALAATSFTIFGGPFLYDPSLGNLLMEVIPASPLAPGGLSFLVSAANHSDTETLECLIPAFGSGCFAGPGESSLVTEFDGTIVSTPEPSMVLLTATGLLGVGVATYRRRTRREGR
jgi:hypothetical protein